MSLRSQKFQQLGFGGIALERLIDIPHSCFGAHFFSHDDHILSPVQAQGLGQQFGHITVQPIEIPHPAHISRREASHIRVPLTQVTCCRHCRTLFRAGADSFADLTIHLHLGWILDNCKIQCSVHGAIVDLFSNIHGFSFPVRGTLLSFKAEKNTASGHAFLCFDFYMTCTIWSHRRTYRSSMILLS